MPKFDPNQSYSVAFDPNASYDAAPSLDLSNSQGEGTYRMADKNGQKVAVPYSQVPTAANMGYSFADQGQRWRYNKDNAADPNRGNSTFAPVGADRNNLVRQAPAALQVPSGVAKGIGTIGKPVMDLVGAATGVPQQTINQSLQSEGPVEGIAKLATMGAVAAPAVGAVPVAATVGGIGTGTVGAIAGKKIGEKAGLSDNQSELLSDAMGLAGGAAGALGGNAVAPKINPAAMKEAAGGLLQSVAHDANKIPVKLDNSGDAALNLMDWQKKTQLGPTINKFLNRITNPKQGPLTYEEARDYYQLLGKLSVEETNKLAPPVRRDLVQMVVGLKQDIGNAADQVGRAADYYQGLGDYAKASKLGEWYDLAQKYAVRGGLAALGAGAVGTAAKFFHEGTSK